MQTPKFGKDPFRLFFPTGLLLASLGLGPWISLLTNHAVYAVEFHRVMMINGFVLSFVVGFLLTAIPRFTQTFFAKSSEIFFIFLSLILAAAFAFESILSWHYLFAALVQLQVFIFAANRFVKRSANPPFSFTFIPIGLGLWFISNLYFFLVSQGLFPPILALSWGAILNQGAILSLILGIGSRLIPALLGWQDVRTEVKDRQQFFQMLGLTLLFLITYFLPFAGNIPYWIRALIVVYLALRFWRLYKLPKKRNWFNWNLWFAAWFVVLSQVVYWGPKDQLVHFLHFLFVGGFAWLTLLISLHVRMAHSTSGSFALKDSKVFLFLGCFVMLATLTRISALFGQGLYLHHLGYAALTLVGVFGIWLWVFYRNQKLKT